MASYDILYVLGGYICDMNIVIFLLSYKCYGV